MKADLKMVNLRVSGDIYHLLPEIYTKVSGKKEPSKEMERWYTPDCKKDILENGKIMWNTVKVLSIQNIAIYALKALSN